MKQSILVSQIFILLNLLPFAFATADSPGALILCKGKAQNGAKIDVVFKEGVLSVGKESKVVFSNSGYIVIVQRPGSNNSGIGGVDGFVVRMTDSNGERIAALNVRTAVILGTDDLHEAQIIYPSGFFGWTKEVKVACRYTGISN